MNNHRSSFSATVVSKPKESKFGTSLHRHLCKSSPILMNVFCLILIVITSLVLTCDTCYSKAGWELISLPEMTLPSSLPSVEGRKINENKKTKVDTPVPIYPNNIAANISNSVPSSAVMMMSTGPSSSAAKITPEIEALARGLNNYHDYILKYVYDNVEYIPMYGSHNDATTTLISKKGNDWDQASLIVALLRAAGYSNAHYIMTDLVYEASFLADCLGLPSGADWTDVYFCLQRAGYRNIVPYPDNLIGFRRVLARMEYPPGSGWYIYFDPAFKRTTVVPGIDINQAMGFDKTSFMASVSTGCTVGSNFIQNVNSNLVINEIGNLSSNLINWIKQNNPNSHIEEIIGGRKIIPQVSNTFFYPPNALYQTSDEVEFYEVPDDECVKVTINYNGINHTFKGYEISGKRVTLFHTGAGNSPELRVDSVLIATGSPTTPGIQSQMILSVDHPYGIDTDSDWVDDYFENGDQDATFDLKSPYSYAIVHDFGDVSSYELVQARNKILSKNRLDGNPEQSEPVLGEALNLMAVNWVRETILSDELMEQMANTLSYHHHQLGIMAQEEGYYIDVKVMKAHTESCELDENDSACHFFSVTGFGSALEHAILEQLQGPAAPEALSTVKLLKINNDNGGKTYFADNTTYNGADGVRETLVALGHSSLDLQTLDALIVDGMTIFVPENPNTSLGEWGGIGIIFKGDTANIKSCGYIISGNYYGGRSSLLDIELDPSSINEIIEAYNDTLRIETSETMVSDPVDITTGAFKYSNVDLALGSGLINGLNLSRTYNSQANYVNANLGYGWSHNYNISLKHYSDGEIVLNGRSPIDAATAIVASRVAFEILKDDLMDPLTTVVSTIIQNWMVEQIINNVVAVDFGEKKSVFNKLPDGSYNSPPGITDTLIDDGEFRLEKRFGTVLNFVEDSIDNVQDADDNTLDFYYSGGQLDNVEDTFGRTLTFNYTVDQLTSVFDSTGRTVYYNYDQNGNLETYTDPAGKIWSYVYDNEHRMTEIIDPISVSTIMNTYNDIGQVETQNVPRKIGGTVSYVPYNFYYTGIKNIEEDPENNRTRYYFDEKGRNVTIEDPFWRTINKEYDGQNHVIKVTDQRLNIAEFVYDGDNNLIKSMGPLSDTEFDIEYDYDSQFRQTDIHLSLNDVRQRHVSHADYDTEHHLTGATIYPDVGEEIHTSSTFYPNGLTHTATDGRGTVATMTYDSNGNPDTTQVAYEPAVDYEYNSIGQLVNITDQAGATTHFEYDDRGLITSKTDPLSKITSYDYYDDGTLNTITDRKNYVTTYTYTPSGKMETIAYQDASTVSFKYDIRDNLSEINDTLGTTTFDPYDEANRLKSITDPHGFTISYEYDAAGNIEEITYPGNKKVSYTYDALNRIDTVTINWLGQVADYEYDTSGRLDTINNFNGTFSTFGYDDANRLTAIKNKKEDSATISTYSFNLDANGNRVYIDQQEPLAPGLNANTTTYTYNDKKNRLLTAGSSNFAYDDEGQLNDKDGTSYTFDYEHRLTSIGASISYSYDGMGKRLKAVRSGVETRYIHDAAGNLLAEADENNVISRYYIYGQGLLAMVTASDDIYCYHFNAIGSTIAMSDSGQDIVNSYAYTPFGNIANEQEMIPQPFKFVGQHGVMTESNGLYYMRARFYDSEVGRFISEDPLGFGGSGVNLYIYASNNPILFIDPLGLFNYKAAGIASAQVLGGLGSIVGGAYLAVQSGGI